MSRADFETWRKNYELNACRPLSTLALEIAWHAYCSGYEQGEINGEEKGRYSAACEHHSAGLAYLFIACLFLLSSVGCYNVIKAF